MAKTYIDAVKYNIYAHFEVIGIVDKSDVVGAVFGQTEGLLGEELDLRDLQRNGRIGRIEVDTTSNSGKTLGSVVVPSSLDMIETAVIAAALESVDRVGPHEAKILVDKIEDTRTIKRDKVIDKAKSLLKGLLETQIPDSKEITELVKKELRTAEIVEYGSEKIPAGPTVEMSNAVIFVEGRADVITLLKSDITNAIAIGGARVPRTLVELSKRKEVTVFLDGDRGGNIVLAELLNANVDIDFVARAPVGKEVEELTRKEIIKALRAKVPVEQYTGSKPKDENGQTHSASLLQQDSRERAEQKSQMLRPGDFRRFQQQRAYEQRNEQRNFEQKGYEQRKPLQAVKQEILHEAKKEEKEEPAEKEKAIAPIEKETAKIAKPARELSAEEIQKALPNILAEMRGSSLSRFYGPGLTVVTEAQIKDMIALLKDANGIEAIAFDGIITQRLVDMAKEKNIKYIAGIRMGNVKKPDDSMVFITI